MTQNPIFFLAALLIGLATAFAFYEIALINSVLAFPAAVGWGTYLFLMAQTRDVR